MVQDNSSAVAQLCFFFLCDCMCSSDCVGTIVGGATHAPILAIFELFLMHRDGFFSREHMMD
jgi:hypothetical protein